MRAQRSVSEMPRLTMDEMFNIATRNTSTWGIEGYEVPKQYQDPLQQVKDRENLKIKKGQKDKSYITKRGHYLDDLAKITKQTPGPSKYDVECKWPDPKEKSKKSFSAPPKRQTFIDAIFREQKLRGVPGAGKYNIIKTLEETKKETDELKKRKIKAPVRPNFLDDYQSLSNCNPGPGNYNPRGILKKQLVLTTKPEQWITKHRDESKKRGKSALPDIGTYKPFSCEYNTFSKMLSEKDQKKQTVQRKVWGQEDRFKDPKKSKSVNKTVQPGPGQYPMIAHWPGKDEGLKKDVKKCYIELITKGPVRSIYY